MWKCIKTKKKLPTLVEMDKLTASGFKQYVREYIETKHRKYFDAKVCRAVSKFLLVGYKEELDYAKKYKKRK